MLLDYELPDYLEDLCEAWALTGSRVICNPPPTDTDLDILVYCTKQQCPIFQEELLVNGWEESNAYGNLEPMDFLSYKKEENDDLFNIILTDDQKWFDLFLAATASSKEKNLLKKDDRIAEFAKVMGRKPKTTVKLNNVWAKMYNELSQNTAAWATLQNQPIMSQNVTLHNQAAINYDAQGGLFGVTTF